MSPRVLVIDDSQIVLTRIEQALSSSGFDVVTTTRPTGNAGTVASCQLVIIDFHMPGFDGKTVLDSLRNALKGSAQNCLFYLYTSDSAVAGQAKSLGFDGAFTQKGDERALVRQVKAALALMHLISNRRKDG